MQAYKTVALGSHRGAPRVWIEGLFPERAGFKPGSKYKAEKAEDHLVLKLSQDGSRVVSSKVTGSRTVPVMDLNSRELLDIFPEGSALRLVMKEGEIVISPLASEKRRQARTQRLLEKLTRKEPLAVGALAFGGGVLDHALHAGLGHSGIRTQLAFANEIREELIEHAALCNDIVAPDTVALAAPLQELAFDERAMRLVPKVDILTAGLPCSGASIAGRSRLKLALPEEHPMVGHLVAAAVAVIARVNPSLFVLENTGTYQRTASAAILRLQLRDLGYTTHEREFLATDFGDLERRQRWCLVAATKGLEIDLNAIVPQPYAARTLNDILEPLEAVADRFRPMEGLKAKQERDVAAGHGFKMQVYTGQETSINTLTKGLAKNRSTDPKIQHPENPDLLRIPTVREHARAKGVPAHLVEGLSQTLGHEVLGQGVCYSPFVALGAYLGKQLKEFLAKPREGFEELFTQPAIHAVG